MLTLFLVSMSIFIISPLGGYKRGKRNRYSSHLLIIGKLFDYNGLLCAVLVIVVIKISSICTNFIYEKGTFYHLFEIGKNGHSIL